MTGRRRRIAKRVAVAVTAVLAWLALAPAPASARPTFLSKQYPRCTACHYSPSGGGLLTPYGRSLSKEEVSTWGRQGDGGAAAEGARFREEAFAYGLLGDALGPVQLGLDIRPSHLNFDVPGRDLDDRNFLMNMDVQAGAQIGGWTFYGDIGREPTSDGGQLNSYEHWVGYQVNETVSVRGGRYLPAYGVRFADHTSFTRRHLDLAEADQIYGAEVAVSTDRSLTQVSFSPGRADALVDDDGSQAFTTSGRYQYDLTPRTVLVGSVLFRGESDLEASSTDTGVAFGWAPLGWLTTWTQADIRFQELDRSDQSYIVANQTSVEVYRGVWARVSPQFRWSDENPRDEVRRLVLGGDFYPRTHWHVNLSYYIDRLVFVERTSKTFLLQLHLYL